MILTVPSSGSDTADLTPTVETQAETVYNAISTAAQSTIYRVLRQLETD